MGEKTLGRQFKSLRDLVCEELRDRIVEGTLRPADRLIERDLADELDVSRIVVREAIQQLVAEKLAVMLPRRGAQVAPLDERGVAELFEVRLNLETLAARCAAERRTDADLDRLQRVLDDARRATEAGDIREATRLNVEFHFAIVDASGNELLASMLRSLGGPVRRVFRMAQNGMPHELDPEHEALLAAIRAQDVDMAGRLAYDHIEATRSPALHRIAAARQAEPRVSRVAGASTSGVPQWSAPMLQTQPTTGAAG